MYLRLSGQVWPSASCRLANGLPEPVAPQSLHDQIDGPQPCCVHTMFVTLFSVDVLYMLFLMRLN